MFSFSTSILAAWEMVGGDTTEEEDRFFLQLLHDFNPGDNGGKIPPDSNPDAANAKEDLRLCSTRLKQSPSRQCTCKKAACIKNLVGRYFQYMQLSENAEKKRKEVTKTWLLDALSVSLDFIGLIPGIGIVADLLSAGKFEPINHKSKNSKLAGC